MPIPTAERWQQHQDRDRQGMVAKGLSQAGEGEMISQKLQFDP